MAPEGTRVVVFDVMGVIFLEGDDTNNLLIPYAKECGFDDAAVLQERYLRASLGVIGPEAFWDGVGDYPDVELKYLDSRLTIDPDFVPAAERLQRSYTLAVLSNDVGRWSAYLRRKYGLDRYFAEVVVSSEHGYRKPDRRLYQILLDGLRVPASSCAFVDDRPANLRRAHDLGMTTVLFDRSGTVRGSVADHRVSSFEELLGIFSPEC